MIKNIQQKGLPLSPDELKGKLNESEFVYLCEICFTPISPPFTDNPNKFVNLWGTYNYGCKKCNALIEGIPIKQKK